MSEYYKNYPLPHSSWLKTAKDIEENCPEDIKLTYSEGYYDGISHFIDILLPKLEKLDGWDNRTVNHIVDLIKNLEDE